MENNKNIIANNKVNAEVTTTKGATTKKSTNKKAASVEKAVSVEKKVEVFDVDSLLDKSLKKEAKSTLNFNQNKSISEKLKSKAETRNEKVGNVLNTILKGVVDLEKGTCKIDIKEIGEEKVQNSFKIDTNVLEIFKTEAKNKNMSLNDYLNKVLGILLK